MSMNKKMSRIERLIAEKCPEGVEYRAIGDFGTLGNRGHP